MPGIVSSCNGPMGMRMDSAEGRGGPTTPTPTRNAYFLPMSGRQGHPQARFSEYLSIEEALHMSMRKALFCFCLFCLLLSACGTATVSTMQKAAPAVEVSPTVNASPTDTSARHSPPTPDVGTPTRLIVPAIGVNASIENIGILPNGDLATPTKSPWEDAGWYYQGTRPGEMGSAVIAGHLDRPGGYPAVFWYLHNLQPGNMVMVMNTTGATLRFKVTRVAAYAPNQAPLQDIFANSGGKYLNLITCAGDWIPSQHQTTLRLVVYTTEL
jgi:hypothetical protein